MSFDNSPVAQALAHARLTRTRITTPLHLHSAQEAYAIQAQIGRALGKDPRGWKVGAPALDAEPSAAPIYDVSRSPGRISGSTRHLIGVEAEIAAIFGMPLPARAAPYTEDEVMSAVEAICVAIEVCASRLNDWQSADDLAKLADHGLNFALVLGDAKHDFASIDFRVVEVRTRINGAIIKEGRGTHAVGNPLVLLPWLANHARTRGGIDAGTAVTTGAWLGLHPIQPGDEVTVEFPALGSACGRFEAD